jgi:hypothetical protein
MTNFNTWSHENLAKFAEEASDSLLTLQEYNHQLLLDLKEVMKAYRDLVILHNPDDLS